MAKPAAEIEEIERRAAVVARGAAQWRDARSAPRREARELLLGGLWSAPVIEAALDAALWDLDLESARNYARACEGSGADALAILPGNIIGPAIQCAYCAALAGTRLTLKAASDERRLAAVVAKQFDALGPPLAGSVHAQYWHGGDEAVEADAFARVRTIVAFGGDATIGAVRKRAGTARVIGYGDAYSVGIIGRNPNVPQAARGAALDVAVFDQRGCMSPQTIYVAGPADRAIHFAQALARELAGIERVLPRGRLVADEPALLADVRRRLRSTAVESESGAPTLFEGPVHAGVPEHVVAVEPFGPPRRTGFARVVSVKPFPVLAQLLDAIRMVPIPLDTIGIAGDVSELDLVRFGAGRVCALGEMQRPPFGYRPRPIDFTTLVP